MSCSQHKTEKGVSFKTTENSWVRKRKWYSFYDGTYAPHLSPEERTAVKGKRELAAKRLPWRKPGSSSSQLRTFWKSDEGKSLAAPPAASPIEKSKTKRVLKALEMGCGTGENVMELFLSPLEFQVVIGVDIVPSALEEARKLLATAFGEKDGPKKGESLFPRSIDTSGRRYSLLCADILDEKSRDAILDAAGGPVDFIFDCQCFHCLRECDNGGKLAAVAYEALLKPGGFILMLTGSDEEKVDRGPTRLSRQEVENAFAGTTLKAQRIESFHFDETPHYRKQKCAKPPKGWLSVWRKRSADEH
eukprot:jgi/Bigna1/138375/aug1.44_g13083